MIIRVAQLELDWQWCLPREESFCSRGISCSRHFLWPAASLCRTCRWCGTPCRAAQGSCPSNCSVICRSYSKDVTHSYRWLSTWSTVWCRDGLFVRSTCSTLLSRPRWFKVCLSLFSPSALPLLTILRTGFPWYYYKIIKIVPSNSLYSDADID